MLRLHDLLCRTADRLMGFPIFWILLAAPFFKPSILGVFPGTDLPETLFNLWRLLAAAMIFALYLLQLLRRRLRPTPVLICLTAFLGFIALSTVIHGRNYWFLANYEITIFAFCLLIELGISHSAETVLDLLFYPLTIVMLINLILQIIYPYGLCRGGSFWYIFGFMGIDNYLAPFLVPYMILTVLRSEILWGRITHLTWFLVGCGAMNLLLTWSTTGVMGLAVALIFLLFFYRTRGELLFNAATSMLAGFGLFWGIVVFRLQNLFAFFIEGVLHKGLSFTGRTDIWDAAMESIMENPLLGLGLAQYGKVYRLRKGNYYHAHNVFLETGMEGGICAFLCFLLMLGFASKPLLEYRRHPYACLLSAGLMACAVMTSMESYLDPNGLMIYGLILLAWHIPKLIAAGDARAARQDAPAVGEAESIAEITD